MEPEFEFDGHGYTVANEATQNAGDVIRLNDGTLVDVTWSETWPPEALRVRVVNGPTNIGPHIGRVWDATMIW